MMSVAIQDGVLGHYKDCVVPLSLYAFFQFVRGYNALSAQALGICDHGLPNT